MRNTSFEGTCTVSGTFNRSGEGCEYKFVRRGNVAQLNLGVVQCNNDNATSAAKQSRYVEQTMVAISANSGSSVPELLDGGPKGTLTTSPQTLWPMKLMFEQSFPATLVNRQKWLNLNCGILFRILNHQSDVLISISTESNQLKYL